MQAKTINIKKVDKNNELQTMRKKDIAMWTGRRRDIRKKETQAQPTRLDEITYFIYREVARKNIDPMRPFLSNMPDNMLKQIDMIGETLTDDIIIVTEALYEAYILCRYERPIDAVDRSQIPEAAKAILVYATLERLKREGLIADYDIVDGLPYDSETVIQVTRSNGQIGSATLSQYQENAMSARKPKGRRL